MYNFIVQILLMVSLGVMIYMVARKVPQIIDVIDESSKNNQKIFARIEKFISSLPLEKVDFIISQLLEKMIRKMKLISMKLDNQLSHHLKKFKEKNSANGENKKLQLFESIDNQDEIVNLSEEKFDIEKENNPQ